MNSPKKLFLQGILAATLAVSPVFEKLQAQATKEISERVKRGIVQNEEEPISKDVEAEMERLERNTKILQSFTKDKDLYQSPQDLKIWESLRKIKFEKDGEKFKISRISGIISRMYTSGGENYPLLEFTMQSLEHPECGFIVSVFYDKKNKPLCDSAHSNLFWLFFTSRG